MEPFFTAATAVADGAETRRAAARMTLDWENTA